MLTAGKRQHRERQTSTCQRQDAVDTLPGEHTPMGGSSAGAKTRGSRIVRNQLRFRGLSSGGKKEVKVISEDAVRNPRYEGDSLERQAFF